MTPNRQLLVPIGVASIAATCSAGVITDLSQARFDTSGYGFEDLLPYRRVKQIDFGEGVVAGVTDTFFTTNYVVDRRDWFGASPTQGDRAWKIATGSVTLDFGRSELTSFGFWYTDLEWSDLVIRVDNDVIATIEGDCTDTPRFFAYEADRGETFSRVTIGFNRVLDGVAIDEIFANPVPSPAAGSALLLAGGIGCFRRRR